MTGEAVLGNDGPDVAIEFDVGGGGSRAERSAGSKHKQDGKESQNATHDLIIKPERHGFCNSQWSKQDEKCLPLDGENDEKIQEESWQRASGRRGKKGLPGRGDSGHN